MSISANNVDLFNKNIINFLKNLCNIIDNRNIQNQIINNISTIQSILYINNTFFIKKFRKDIYIYKDNIYNEDIKIIDIFDKLNFIPSIKIKDVWNNLNNNNKDICWKYFKAFILLCEK